VLLSLAGSRSTGRFWRQERHRGAWQPRELFDTPGQKGTGLKRGSGGSLIDPSTGPSGDAGGRPPCCVVLISLLAEEVAGLRSRAGVASAARQLANHEKEEFVMTAKNIPHAASVALVTER
jgi:hypothetical protein